MKKRLSLFCLLATASILVFACSGVPKEVSLDASSSGKEVKVAVNGKVTVTLDAKATTGFSWTLANNSDPTVVSADHEYQPAPQGKPGAGGKDVWTLQALKAGKSTLFLEYSQPWPGGTKKAETFTLTVVVK